MANAFAHLELSTDNLQAAKKFYGALFAWKISPSPMPDYTMIETGGEAGGGITKKMMPQQPTAWMPYVEVADVTTTLAKAKKLGARIVLDTMDVGEVGEIGIFIDPTGAALGVWGQPKAQAAPKKAAPKKAASKKAAVAKGSKQPAGAKASRKPAGQKRR